MNARHAVALALRGMCAAVMVLAVGCGGGGGGGGCGMPGSTSECGSGDICSNIQGDGNQCRPLCTTRAECPAGENCNGIDRQHQPEELPARNCHANAAGKANSEESNPAPRCFIALVVFLSYRSNNSAR